MIPMTELPLVEQRLAMRQRLSAQRECLARQLGDISPEALPDASPEDRPYPRSITMRFLSQEMGMNLLAQVATFLVGYGMRSTKST